MNRVIGSEVDTLQHESFSYFEHEVNLFTGLVIDKTAQNSPWRVATTGFALATGYQSLYCDFLDMKTGRRAWQCELPTVDNDQRLRGNTSQGGDALCGHSRPAIVSAALSAQPDLDVLLLRQTARKVSA